MRTKHKKMIKAESKHLPYVARSLQGMRKLAMTYSDPRKFSMSVSINKTFMLEATMLPQWKRRLVTDLNREKRAFCHGRYQHVMNVRKRGNG